jgi:hypothetical protein
MTRSMKLAGCTRSHMVMAMMARDCLPWLITNAMPWFDVRLGAVAGVGTKTRHYKRLDTRSLLFEGRKCTPFGLWGMTRYPRRPKYHRVRLAPFSCYVSSFIVTHAPGTTARTSVSSSAM